MMTRRPFVIWMAVMLAILVGISTWQISTLLYSIMIVSSHPEYTYLPRSREHTEILYSADSLPQWDFTRLINVTNFEFLLTNSVCDDNNTIEILIAVSSAPANFERRKAIRETWGTPRPEVRLIFTLGSVNNQQLQDKLDQEDGKYHDLVQGNFKDAYKNLTYKHVMAFKYTIYYCPKAKYMLKIDDDIFVNVPFFVEYIAKSLPPDGAKNFVLCSIMDGSPVLRQKSKWFVPFEEYPHSFYPVYCSGYAILYAYDVVFRLYREAQRGEYFWVEDAYITGTLGKRIHLRHTQLENSLLTYKDMYKMIETNGSEGTTAFLYGPLNISADLIRKLWLVVQNRMKNRNHTTND